MLRDDLAFAVYVVPDHEPVEVFAGRDMRLDRRVAVKILRPDLARDPNFQERFRREAQSAASLNHPNIVQVWEFQAHNLSYNVSVEFDDDVASLHPGRRGGRPVN